MHCMLFKLVKNMQVKILVRFLDGSLDTHTHPVILRERMLWDVLTLISCSSTPLNFDMVESEGEMNNGQDLAIES